MNFPSLAPPCAFKPSCEHLGEKKERKKKKAVEIWSHAYSSLCKMAQKDIVARDKSGPKVIKMAHFIQGRAYFLQRHFSSLQLLRLCLKDLLSRCLVLVFVACNNSHPGFSVSNFPGCKLNQVCPSLKT